MLLSGSSTPALRARIAELEAQVALLETQLEALNAYQTRVRNKASSTYSTVSGSPQTSPKWKAAYTALRIAVQAE